MNRRRVDWLRVWAGAYFGVQFALVHVMYFGLAIEPVEVALRAPYAFGWANVMGALGNFYVPFLAGIEFGSVVMVAIWFVPFTICLAWALLPLALYIFVVYQLVWYCIIKLRQISHARSIGLDNVVVVKAGAPGTGKSSSGLYEAVVMARKMWRKLEYKYFTYAPRVNRWRKNHTKYAIRLAEWEEIKFSYNFFAPKREGGAPFPCLVTNIPCRVDGRYTCQLTKKHLAQRHRLPAYSVLFVDEIGAMLNIDMSKQRMNTKNAKDAQVVVDVDNMFRLCRHYGEFRIVCTEQQRDNIYKGVRNVVSKVEVLDSQKWVIKPYPLLVPFAVFKWLCLWRVKPNDEGKRLFPKLVAPWLVRIENMVCSVGFRRYRYKIESGHQGTNVSVLSGKRTFYLQSMLNFQYDERTYRNLYKCKDSVCEPKIWTSLVVEDSDENRLNFLRVIRAPQPKPKKEAA